MESELNASTVAVDLAKSVFQLAVADEHWRIVGNRRLTSIDGPLCGRCPLSVAIRQMLIGSGV
jgi:hypothetical protein